jgi:hypothetical protein
MAKPLVATGFAVEGLGLQPDVHYLRAETPSEFVAQIRRLEQDGFLRQRLSLAGRSHVQQNYAWDVVGPVLDSVYRRVAQFSIPRRTTLR